jgi:hypothetical protein
MQVKQVVVVLVHVTQGEEHKVQLELVEFVRVLLGQDNRQLPLK